MNTYEIIKELVKQHFITVAQLERTLDLSNGSISKWAKSKPNSEPLEKVADYLNVSTDYLLGRTDNPSIAGGGSEPDDIDKIIDRAMFFDGMPLTDDDRRSLRGIISGYMNSKGD